MCGSCVGTVVQLFSVNGYIIIHNVNFYNFLTVIVEHLLRYRVATST